MLLPRGVRRQRPSHISSSGICIIMLATAVPAFFLGTLASLYAGLANCQHPNDHSNDVVLERRIQERIKQIERNILKLRENEIEQEVRARLQLEGCGNRPRSNAVPDQGGHPSSSALFDPQKLGKYAVFMAQTPKANLTALLDLGVPLDLPSEGAENALILYSRTNTIPNGLKDMHGIPELPSSQALENCDTLNIILTPMPSSKHCVAMIPQYQSYQIQKWMRLSTDRKLDSKAPLQMVGRGMQENGRNAFKPPKEVDHRKNWDMLKNYVDSLDSVLNELKPILEKIAKDNTVIVSVVNFGQAELLLNFVCSAHNRGLDLSNMIVFTTDEESTELARSMGLTAYFDQRNFGDIPSGAAGRYGDRKFVAMMMAKTLCVQLVSMLGYNFLFQDVDIVWFRNPLEYFHNNVITDNFDIIFQDDGGHSVRYAPYSANSGFYYVRHNDRTQHFLTALLMSGDLVLKSDSHQQAMIAVLNEHASLYGLKVKVISRDSEEFPGGYHWNQVTGKYMHAFFRKEVHPYIFHMSWTLNKANKLLYFRQMGEWYVQDHCVEHKKSEIDESAEDLRPLCCAAEPLISCHYRDKPSIIPCKDSPSIDRGRRSFW